MTLTKIEPGQLWRPPLWRRLLGQRTRITVPFHHPCLTNGWICYREFGDDKPTVTSYPAFLSWIEATGAVLS